MQSEEATVIVSYGKDLSNVEVEGSKDSHTVTLSRQIDNENRFSPNIHSSGNISVE